MFELPIPGRALLGLSLGELERVGIVELEYARDLAALLANSLSRVLNVVQEE